MKKNIISCFVIVVFAVLFVSCSSKKSNYSLRLVIDSWSDQDIDYPEKNSYLRILHRMKRTIFLLKVTQPII